MKKAPVPRRQSIYLVRATGLEPARSYPLDPKSYISFSLIQKNKEYMIGTGRKRVDLFPAQSTKKNVNNMCTLAFADELRTKADNYGKLCFRAFQSMVFHHSEPPSFLRAL